MLAVCVILGAITYMDRVCIAMTSKDMARELGLSDFQMGFVFSAFTLAYGLFEIPTGWWGDRIGTRAVLTRIVTWWSAFTMLTAAAANYSGLLAVRFLFGAGEAGAWPNVARTFSRWFPVSERGRAQGIFFTGAHGGAAVTPILVTWMLSLMHWRSVFLIFGSVGFFWAIGWYWWFRNEPSEHRWVNEAERRLIEAGRVQTESHDPHRVPWGRILSDRNVLLLSAAYFAQSYGFYFFITWLPTYLARERGFSAMNLGIFTGLPMLACVVADVTGGIATDAFSRRFGLRTGRAAVAGASFLIASVCMLAGTASDDATNAAILLALASGWSAFLLGAAWGTCLDIAGPHVGVVSACMNTAGQVGGVFSPVIIGFVLDQWRNWTMPLYLTGALYFFGALCWCFIDPRRPVSGLGEQMDEVAGLRRGLARG
ncbi:MAG: putative sulfoacetate transporter SauU [Bryobacteraceae bacterium]|nr:putative sulfoacetate transporter SauU [Bryobacteraceae bacterium]